MKVLALALALTAAAVATPLCSLPPMGAIGTYGSYCVAVNGVESWGPIDEKSGGQLVSTEGDTRYSIADYDLDPFFNWSFTTSVVGLHAVIFNIPFLGGPYGQVASSASGSLTPGKGPIEVKNATVTTLIDLAAIPQVLALADTKVAPPFSGTVGAKVSMVNFATKAAGTFGVMLKFEQVGEGSVTYNGRLQLMIPEPGTSALLGAGLLMLGFAARRRG
jgi:hypothetical protein